MLNGDPKYALEQRRGFRTCSPSTLVAIGETHAPEEQAEGLSSSLNLSRLAPHRGGARHVGFDSNKKGLKPDGEAFWPTLQTRLYTGLKKQNNSFWGTSCNALCKQPPCATYRAP